MGNESDNIIILQNGAYKIVIGLIGLETKTNFGQTDATETVYKNNERYERKGKNVRKENDKWVADFSGNFKKSNYSIKHHPVYLVNNNTVQYNKSFSFVRDADNKILYYKACVLLDSVTAVKEYGQNIKEEGGTSFPEFSEIELSCIIDRDGHLMSYAVSEKMKINKTIVVDITTTTTNKLNYIILSHDVQPSVQEPKI